MSRQNINLGSHANDATGDTLRVAFGKVNNNFIELYASGGANTGNVTFQNNIVVGTGDESGGSGLFFSAGPSQVANLQYIRLRGGDDLSHIHLDTANSAAYDFYFGDDSKYVKLERNDTGGNVVIGAFDGMGTKTWNFGTDGALKFPYNGDENIRVQRYGMGNVVAYLDGGWTLGEYNGANWGTQGMRINPGIEGYADINLPSDADAANGTPLSISSYSSTGNVRIYANGNSWLFDNLGGIQFPLMYSTRGDVSGGTVYGQTIKFGDKSHEAIIAGPDGDATYQNAQRIVIEGGVGHTGTSGEGGDIYVWAGRGGDTNGNGGDVKIRGGYGPGNGQGGYIRIEAGDIQGTGTTGYVYVKGGDAGAGTGGYVQIYGGSGYDGDGGYTELAGGYGVGNGGYVNIAGGVSSQGLAHYGNVTITSGASQWKFNNNGVFNIVGNVSWSSSNTVIESISNGNGEGYSVLNLIPDSDRFPTDQYIIIDPGVTPSHVHLRAGGSMDDSSAILSLGGDASYFRLDSGPNPPAYVASNNKIWTFNQEGGLGFPDSTTQTTAWVGIPGPYADDIEAATNSVAIGNPYYKAGGQVYVRLS